MTGVKRVVTGFERVVTGFERVVTGFERVVTGVSLCMIERTDPPRNQGSGREKMRQSGYAKEHKLPYRKSIP